MPITCFRAEHHRRARAATARLLCSALLLSATLGGCGSSEPKPHPHALSSVRSSERTATTRTAVSAGTPRSVRDPPSWVPALRNRVRQADRSSSKLVALSSAATFHWRRVFFFMNGGRSFIDSRLGFSWPQAPSDLEYDRQTTLEGVPYGYLVVFIRGHRVVSAAYARGRAIELACVANQGYLRSKARFDVHRSAKHYTNPPTLPLTRHAQPTAREQKCLRIFGAS